MADDEMIDDERRGLIGAMAVAGIVGGAMGAPSPAAAQSADSRGTLLETAFRSAMVRKAAGPFDAKARMGFLAKSALVVDHDIPFPLDAAAYEDHLAFHASHWERHEWLPYELQTAVHGDTGIVSCNYIERGKPKDAGFRLRAGTCTAVCAWSQGRWVAVGLALSPLSSQIVDASPG